MRKFLIFTGESHMVAKSILRVWNCWRSLQIDLPGLQSLKLGCDLLELEYGTTTFSTIIIKESVLAIFVVDWGG